MLIPAFTAGIHATFVKDRIIAEAASAVFDMFILEESEFGAGELGSV